MNTGKHARRQSYWNPQNAGKEVPVSLVKQPGYTKGLRRTRHRDAACWYWTDQNPEVAEPYIYPLVFTRDTAGTWYGDDDGKGGVSELWDLTQGQITDVNEEGGECSFDILILLRRITEHIEQGNFPDDVACVQTMDDLHETLEQLR